MHVCCVIFNKVSVSVSVPVWDFLQNLYDNIHITFSIVQHCFRKLKIQILCRCGGKRKQIAFLVASNFVIHQTNFDIFGV